MIGRRMYGGSSTYIPLKVNQAGVIPVIFASSLLYLPALAVNLTTATTRPHGRRGSRPTWSRATTRSTCSLYFGLIVFFTYFYVAITFNPTEVSDNMKKYGGFIPGIRAGRPTAEYLDYVLSRITAVGALYLGMIALIPLIALSLFNANSNFPFGGTAILIIVGVGLETVKQIESQLQQRNYEGSSARACS
jgi:preprotein translocase subunit SecY